MKNKNIFTFWEPKDKIPDYIKLCMETWKIFLPEYDIKIIDYKNIDEYLGENFYDKILYKNFSLPMQADAIRCALLNKYGGIWMDCDTIITSNKVKELFENNTKFLIISRHIGFIAAHKDSILLQKWLYGIKYNLLKYKIMTQNKFIRKLIKTFNHSLYNQIHNWDYLGNSIINPHIENMPPAEFISIDRKDICALPEINYYSLVNNLSSIDKFTKFYFENDFSDFVFENNRCGIIMLHNSWTPEKYKNMSEEEFLNTNNTLSNIIKRCLKQ